MKPPRKNPEWVADLRWRDLPGLAPLIIATQKDPIAMIETAAKAIKHLTAREMPRVAMFADRTPTLPVLDLWCWAFVQHSRGNNAAAQKRATRALKAATKAGIHADRALYAILAVLESAPQMIDLKAIAAEGVYGAIDRKQAFVVDLKEGRERGLKLPTLLEWEVVETVFYSIEDSLKAALVELRAED